jgi:hypothetical protein
MPCKFQYDCLILYGLAPVVVLRSFRDRVEVYTVSVSISQSLGHLRRFFSKFTLLFYYLYSQSSYLWTYYCEDRATIVPNIAWYLSGHAIVVGVDLR